MTACRLHNPVLSCGNMRAQKMFSVKDSGQMEEKVYSSLLYNPIYQCDCSKIENSIGIEEKKMMKLRTKDEISF